jgi:hypothetical protein
MALTQHITLELETREAEIYKPQKLHWIFKADWQGRIA